ncbi:Rieske 2Fe-2S domain-containing protein [Phenylobacterium sp. LjRoot219]|uniref:Rieske (2Fe-2S) protein n=1 Tax=Phenylobacterium sp. LjRoot219 TaxID=3342283 RepID=UPI003ECE5278
MAASSPAQSNPARPVAGVRLCALDELADPGARGFRFRQDGALFAGFVVRRGALLAGYVDSCPHAGWPLGALDERYLTRTGEHILCAGHGALFALADGACLAGPCAGDRLLPWPIELRGNDLFTA